MKKLGGIRAWQRLSPEITTSGMLREQDLETLANDGVRRVIDLTPPDHEEALKGEREKLSALGIDYANIPVPFDAPEEQHYLDFVKALEGAAGRVHVHCVANWRVSAFFYRYHLEHGMDEGEAFALMREHWSPTDSDHPTAAPWKEFVSRARQANVSHEGDGQGEEQQ